MSHFDAIRTAPHLEKMRYVVFSVFAAFAVFALYWHWGSIIREVIELQREFHSQLASHISAVAKDTATYGWALIGLSFAYGVFHAIGPGHGKAVIATYLGTHRESLAKGIGISMATALLQALVAISLVSVLAKVLSFRFADIDNYGEDMALVSYVLVIILGLILFASAVRRLLHLRRSSQTEHQVTHAHHEDHRHHGHDHKPHNDHNHDHDHQHHAESCGCQHAYVPEADQSWLRTIAVIFSIGIRPCSGAIVVLIYAHLVGVFHYGVAATLLMGLGTGITVSAIAVASQYARQWLEGLLAMNNGAHGLLNPAMISIALRLAGGAILVLMGWGLYQTALLTSSGNPLL